MITPDQAWDWNVFKSQGGPTYAGSAGWKRYTDFLISKMPEFGAVDLDYVEIPYDHYIVDDWPDRRTHMHDSGMAVEKLVTDGTPVPVVASYGMTSGSTPPEGITAPMLYYDPAHPPAAAQIAGKILVFQTAPYPDPPYSNSFLDNYTLTDYEWRSPGKWAPLFTPPPASVTSSYHCRWVWSQLNGFAAIGINGHAAGMVVVYDLSPGAAFGLAQRSVYTPDGKAGLGATYVNCPTLTLDRVNGAKVLADAKAGKTATLTLTARFQRDTGKAIIAYLPGRNYGTPQDEQVLLATHTDAMSLIEENGGLGMLGIMSYFNHIPQSARPRTLVFYFDCRHFMPGGEAQLAAIRLLHDPPRAPEADRGHARHGAHGRPADDRSRARRQRVRLFQRAPGKRRRHHEPDGRLQQQHLARRSDRESGHRQSLAAGRRQGRQRRARRQRRVPGHGEESDEQGPRLPDPRHRARRRLARRLDADLRASRHGGRTRTASTRTTSCSRWPACRSSPANSCWSSRSSSTSDGASSSRRSSTFTDADFVAPQEAAAHRQTLVDQYVAAFRHVEAAALDDARSTLKDLAANVSASVVTDQQGAIRALVDGQLAKLTRTA